jgi:hypothetical protein
MKQTHGKNWLKIKTALRQEAVIVSFTEPAVVAHILERWC